MGGRALVPSDKWLYDEHCKYTLVVNLPEIVTVV